MKILITTVFFPPQNAIASQRPSSWANEWSKQGHDVTVLTIEKDRTKSDLAPMPMDGFQTVEVPAGGLIRQLQLRRNAQKSEDSTGGAVAKPPSSFRKWLRRRGFLSSVRWPDVFDFWVPTAVRAIPSVKFDLIVSTFGPPASLAVGHRAKQLNPSALWICDFRDLWTENHVYPGFWPLTRLERFAELRYLKKADAVTTVSEALAVSLRTRTPTSTSVAVFENGFAIGELESLDDKRAFSETPLTLVYTGSLHPDQRNPRPLLEAFALLSPAEREKLHIVFAGAREAFLEAAIHELQLGQHVRMVGSLARKESLRYQRDADVLLFFEKQHESARDGVLTGKLFEYLATGRPIMAIGISNDSTVGSLIQKNGCGAAHGNDVAAIKAALLKLISEGRKPKRDVKNPGDIVHKYDRSSIANRMLTWIQNGFSS